MEFTPKRHTLTPFSSTHHGQIYFKSYSNDIFSQNGSNLDKYINYSEIYEDDSINCSDKSEISYNSIETPENIELNRPVTYNRIYSIEKPIFDEFSSFPKGDVRHFSRKTAFYNKRGTAEQHYLEYFKSEKSDDLIDTSSYGIDISIGENGHIRLENEVNYEDIGNDKIQSSDLEVNIEIKLTENKPMDSKDNCLNKSPISFSDLDCYEQIKSGSIVENDDKVKKEKKSKKHSKSKKDKKKKEKRTEEETKKDESYHEKVEELTESPTEILDNSTLIDFNTPILDVVSETDKPSVEEVEVLSEVNQNEEKLEDNLSKFEIDFAKLIEMEKNSSADEKTKDKQPEVITDEKEEFDHYEDEPLLKEINETDSVEDNSTGASNISSIEIATTTKKNDKASITYVSEDKMFIVTGTMAGFVHVWSFLQPYQSNNEKDLTDSNLKEKRRKMSVGGDWEDEQELIEEHQMINNTPLRKLEVLGWSNIINKPDVSFKAHESSILSLQITPKTFSKGKIDHIMVTSSLDRSFKVWKISNIDKKKDKSGLEYNTTISYNDENSKNGEARIKLLGWFEDLNDVFVDAAFIPNTDKIIVSRHTGVLEKFKLGHLNNDNKKTNRNNLTSVSKVSTDQKFIVGSISTSCNYYAVGGIDGNVRVYDVETLNLLDSVDCRNEKGSNSVGREVSGIEWNKKDDLILVTTLDSRIRLLSFNNNNSTNNDTEGESSRIKKQSEIGLGNGKKLRYVEKFKGHTNYTNYFKARFFGTSEQIVMCPSESGHIYVWKISSPLYNNNLVNGKKDDEIESLNRVNNGAVIKNNDCFGFKTEERNLLGCLDIYNVHEWDKLLQIILDSRRKEIDDKEVGGCLMCKKGPKNENPNPNSDLLMITSPNGSEIKYSVMDVRYFQN